jgi:hypothetical protein
MGDEGASRETNELKRKELNNDAKDDRKSGPVFY